jgi:hypothetical protein
MGRGHRATAHGATLVAAVLVLAGCAAQREAGSPSSASASPPTSEAGVQADADRTGGRMTVVYEEATSPGAEHGKALLQQHRSLEDYADETNALLNLPTDVTLRGAQCDQPNAFWTSRTRTLTICYEDTDFAHQVFAAAGDPDPAASAVGMEEASFAHEFGHMVIDLFDLPATGREEDDADQMSAYLLQQPDDNGRLDPTNVKSLLDSAREFDAISQSPSTLDDEAFYDAHSLNQTRKYNLLCWVYGADPTGQAELVSSGQLPKARADNCAYEWNRLDRAWSRLLDPHLKG